MNHTPFGRSARAVATLTALALGACATPASTGGGGFYQPYDAAGASSGGAADGGTTDGGGTSGGAVDGGGGTSGGVDGGASGGGTSGGGADTTCTPATCASLGATCGSAPNGCGGTITCGTCPSGQTCGASNTCQQGPCVKKSCAQVGAACGVASDGCGGTQTCPACPSGKACQSNQCVCVPKTCSDLGLTCGQVDNGCGQPLDCGACPTCDVGCPGGYSCDSAGVCSGGTATQLKLNMVTVPVSGVVTLNGKAPGFGQYCTDKSTSKYLRVRFEEVDKGYTFEVLRTCKSLPHDFTFETVVFPGTYRVRVSGYSSGYSNLPTTMQTIHDKLTITKATSGIVLNVVTVPVSGVVTLNGKTPSFGQYCTDKSTSKYLRVRFEEVDKGYTFEVLRTCKSLPHDFTFETVVFPGTYRVRVSGYSSGYSNLPTTMQTIYAKLPITKATSGIALNVVTVPVSGVVTLNGKTPSFGQYCTEKSTSKYLRVRFEEVDKGYSFEVLRTCKSLPHDFTFETVVFPGTYRVRVSGYSSGYSNLPTTMQTIYAKLPITKATSGIALNVVTVPVSGVVTLNGKTPSFGQYCTDKSTSKYLRVRFEEVDKGYSFEVLRTCKSLPHDFTFETVVFPGTYRVRVSGYSSGYSNLPTTMQIIYDKLPITKATSGIALNVVTVPVSGVVTLNGKTPSFGQYCTEKSTSKYLRVRFEEVDKGYSFEVLRTCKSLPHDFTFETVVFPGTYRVRVSGYSSGYSNLPTTMQVIYDKLSLTKATSGVTLNVTTVPVAGVVTLNGKTPSFGQYCTDKSTSKYLRVRFEEVDKGYSFEVLRTCKSLPHDFTFETVVFPGTYRVRVSGYSSGYSNLPTTMQTIVSKLKIP